MSPDMLQIPQGMKSATLIKKIYLESSGMTEGNL